MKNLSTHAYRLFTECILLMTSQSLLLPKAD